MLENLFGNQNVQKVLMFLFVNGKCYGTQLHRMLNTPLTPIQKALLRLEGGGIIMSSYEGKTRLYRFNPGYPLQQELEQLLKKAYTLLPAQEKKSYYVTNDEQFLKSPQRESKARILLDFWKKLSSVSRLNFHANSKSRDEEKWKGKGTGEVTIIKESSHILIFNEKGVWKTSFQKEVNFKNSFRWTLDTSSGVISLEHLRHGADNPVFLFDLAPSSKYSLSSVDSHLCEGDIYFGKINFDRYSMRLHWRVIGPRKNEEMDYYYT